MSNAMKSKFISKKIIISAIIAISIIFNIFALYRLTQYSTESEQMKYYLWRTETENFIEKIWNIIVAEEPDVGKPIHIWMVRDSFNAVIGLHEPSEDLIGTQISLPNYDEIMPEDMNARISAISMYYRRLMYDLDEDFTSKGKPSPHNLKRLEVANELWFEICDKLNNITNITNVPEPGTAFTEPYRFEKDKWKKVWSDVAEVIDNSNLIPFDK